MVATKTALCSKLPVIYIDTEGSAAVVSKEDYLDATLAIQGNTEYNSETTTLYSGATEIKGRGNSTWLRFPKKPYRLKLDKKADLFGLGKNKNWALLANYIDDSLVRNSLAGDIAEQLGVLKMDSVAVELVLNGEHLGSYLLIEHVRVDDKRVEVFDWEGVAGDAAEAIAAKHGFDGDTEDALAEYMEENMGWMTTKTVTFNGKTYKLNDYLEEPLPDFDGGFLIEMDEYMDEVSSFYSKYNTPLMVKTPEFVKTDEVAYAYIQSYMNRFEDAVYSKDHTITHDGVTVSYTDLVDFDSLVAYWLTSEILVNEAGAKSTYVHKENGEKLTFGPIWDFDYSSGGVSSWSGQPAESWCTANRNWFKGITKDPYFIVKMRELFLENEAYFDNLIAKGSTLDTWYDYLYESGIKNTELWHFSRGFEEDYAVLRSWLTRRLAFLKTMLATDKSVAESLGVSFRGCDLDITAESVLGKVDGAFYVNADTVDKLTLSITNANAAGYNYYVNSKLVGSGTFTDSKAEIVLDKALLTEDAGKKNVIVVRLKNEKGEFTAVQMATVTVVPADSTFVTLTLTDGSVTDQIKVLAGDKVYLGVSSACGKNHSFDGWVSGDNLYAAGTNITVSQDIVLSARYKLCKNEKATHNFVINENYDYTCSSCKLTKPTDVKYKDVASLSFKISTHYQNKYTGTAVLPKINIYDGGTKLTKDVHYTLTAENNIDTGYASYTLKGLRSGGYDGMTQIAFMIIPGKMSSVSGGVDTGKTYTYTGSPVTPAFNLTFKGIALQQDKDFYISDITDNTAAGVAKVTVTGMGNFTGSQTYSFTIVGAPVKNATVTLSKTSYTYNGTYHKPAVTVKLSDGTVLAATNYTVSYKNNLSAGTAEALVTFKGNYSGEIKQTFKILPVSAAKFSVSVKAVTYNGKVQTPSVTVKDSKGNTLVKDTDYTVKCTKKAKNTGKHDVTVTFKGNYSGEVVKSFEILPISAKKLTASVKNATYNGKVQMPSVTVKNSKGSTLVKGTHYTVKYTKNAKNPGKYTVTVTFIGNYKGTMKLTFRIVPATPKKVTVSQTITTVTLKWSKVSTADCYRVYKYNSKTK